MEGVPWERELGTRFTQFSEKGSELVGFGVESPDLDKFCLHNVFCMKDVVRIPGKSKQNVQPSTNANRKAVECKTWHSLPDNAFAVDMTNKLRKDLAEVYEMMGHHARVTFSTLLCRGKEDSDNDVANAVDVADNAVDVGGTIDVADIVLDVVAVPAAVAVVATYSGQRPQNKMG